MRVVLSSMLVVCLAAGVWGLRDRATTRYFETQRYEDIYYLPPPAWLQVMSLGHRRALADLIWLKSLIYFGEEFAHEGAVKHVFDYGDAMLALDPDFERVYRWIGMAGVYTPKESPIEYLERSIQVLRDGVDRFPNSGRLAWEAGATIAYELVPRLPRDHPEREALRLEASEHMISAARLGGGPPWLVLTNATTLGKLGQAERQQRHLEEMYAMVKDPDVKEQIEIRLSVLRDQAYAEAFKTAHEEFEARRRAEFPYMPSSLYYFVSEPIKSGSGLDAH